MKALVGAFNQEKALVGAFSVIVQPVVEPMELFTALLRCPSRCSTRCPKCSSRWLGCSPPTVCRGPGGSARAPAPGDQEAVRCGHQQQKYSCVLYSLIHNIKVIISLLLPRWGSLVTTPPRSPGAVSPWTRPCCSDTATSPRTPATTTTTTTTAWAQGPHLGPPPLCWPAWTSRYFRSGAKH